MAKKKLKKVITDTENPNRDDITQSVLDLIISCYQTNHIQRMTITLEDDSEIEVTVKRKLK